VKEVKNARLLGKNHGEKKKINQRHHYLVTARDTIEQKKSRKNSFSTSATKMMIRKWLPTGYAFLHKAIIVHIADIKETTKEAFKDFLLKCIRLSGSKRLSVAGCRFDR